jgi:hypothetical protein
MANLEHLDAAIEKVEFKHTVAPGEEAIVDALVDAHGGAAQRRTVYFYDTKDLRLFDQHLVLRARVTEGDDPDSTVKLRPIKLSDHDANWRTIAGIRIELDVVGSDQIPSAKLDGTPDQGEIEAVAASERPIRSLFSGTQEDLIGDASPKGFSMKELKVLGPIEARVWSLKKPHGFPHKLGIEEWTLPDHTRFLELSFKVAADEAPAAQADFHALLDGLHLDLKADQTAKTSRVLEFFAARHP